VPRPARFFYVPGEHDVLTDNGKQYLDRFGKEAKGNGWYSFDHKGAHFIGLVNVMDLKAGGLGSLGTDQLKWMQDDVRELKSSTPVIVFAHIPLWTVLSRLGLGHRRQPAGPRIPEAFWLGLRVEWPHPPDHAKGGRQRHVPHGAVHRVSLSLRRARRPSPGPMKVPADQLRSVLGISHVNYVQGSHSLALVDSTLA